MQCTIGRENNEEATLEGVSRVQTLTGTGFRIIVLPHVIEICELDEGGQVVSRLSARLDGLVSPPRRPPWEEPGFHA